MIFEDSLKLVDYEKKMFSLITFTITWSNHYIFGLLIWVAFKQAMW